MQTVYAAVFPSQTCFWHLWDVHRCSEMFRDVQRCYKFVFVVFFRMFRRRAQFNCGKLKAHYMCQKRFIFAKLVWISLRFFFILKRSEKLARTHFTTSMNISEHIWTSIRTCQRSRDVKNYIFLILKTGTYRCRYILPHSGHISRSK